MLVLPGKPVTKLQRGVIINLPLSVIQLGSYIRSKGYLVQIFDMRVQQFSEIENSISDCFAVGFSCMTGNQIKHAIVCAKKIRVNLPDIPFIFGGIHPTLHPKETLNHYLVDYVVRGEGEETLFELLEFLTGKAGKDSGNILGLGYKNDDKEPIVNGNRPFLDLDDLPMAGYDLIDISKYGNIKYSFDYQSSRGCPHRCAFCYNIAFNNRRYRAKKAELVVAELEQLQSTYDVVKFGFVDDEFFIDKKRVERFCDLIHEKKMVLEWNASCRLDLIQKYPDELMQKVKMSGCKTINFGAESGSPGILKAISKDISVEDIINGAKHTINNGVIPYLSFMSGFPGENIEDSLMTKDLISKLHKINNRIVPNGVFVYNPYPGTPLYDMSISMGAKMPDNFEEWGNWTFKYDADSPWLSKKQKNVSFLLFCIVRFRFYLNEIKIRKQFNIYKRYLVYLAFLPWIISANIRWRFNIYTLPTEWKLWKFFMQRIFGYL